MNKHVTPKNIYWLCFLGRQSQQCSCWIDICDVVRPWRITSCRLRGLCRPLLCGSASWKLWWGWTCLWTSSAPSVALSASLRGGGERDVSGSPSETRRPPIARRSLFTNLCSLAWLRKACPRPFPWWHKEKVAFTHFQGTNWNATECFSFFFSCSKPLHVLVQAADDQVPLVDDGHQLVQQLLLFVPVLLSPVALWSFADDGGV